jgi:hypothetical protein
VLLGMAYAEYNGAKDYFFHIQDVLAVEHVKRFVCPGKLK